MPIHITGHRPTPLPSVAEFQAGASGARSQSPVRAQLDSVANGAEAPRSPSPSSRSPSPSSLFSQVRDAMRNTFTGANTGGVKAGANRQVDSTPSDYKVAAAKLNADGEKEIAKFALGLLDKSSAILTPLLHSDGPPTPAGKAASARALLDLGLALKTLNKQVEDEKGHIRPLMNVSSDVTNQIQELLKAPISGSDAKTLEGLLGTSARRQSVLNHSQAPLQIIRYASDIKQVAVEVARMTGDAGLLERAQSLFPDPLVRELNERMGTAQMPGDEFNALDKSGLYTADRRLPGVRYGNIGLNMGNAMQLKNGGGVYAAHPIRVDGKEIAIATSYPKTESLDKYLQLLTEVEPGCVVVLSSEADILNGNKRLPWYFRGHGEHGNYTTDSRKKGGATDFEHLKVQDHVMTITRPDGTKTDVLVKHLTNWEDQTTTSAQALLKLAASLPPGRCVVHCNAGAGRTGLLVAIKALREDPSRTAEGVLTAMRTDRSHHMVQTQAQLETLVEAQREVQAMPTPTDEPIHGTLADVYPDVYPNRVSRSWPDPMAPTDGEPLYQNTGDLRRQNLWRQGVAP